MPAPRPRPLTACSLLLLLAVAPQAAADPTHRTGRATQGQIGLALGHHQAFGLNFPAASPMLEFRAGYQVSEGFLGRIDIGAGAAKMLASEEPSFEGAWTMNINLAVLLAWTPQLSDDLHLVLGGTFGVWFLSLYGDDLTGVLQSGSAGSPVDYLEAASFHVGAVAGLEWQLSTRWAMSFEVRYVWAQGQLGNYNGNLAGLTGSVGFIYRMAAWDVGQF